MSPRTEYADDTMLRKRAIRVFVVVFIVSLVLLGSYNVLARMFHVTSQGAYEYDVTVTATGEDRYILLVPCVVDSDGEVNLELSGRLRCTGDCNTTILTTEKGPFLAISGQGNAQMVSKLAFDTAKGDHLRSGFSPRFSSIHNGTAASRRYSVWLNLSEDAGVSSVSVRVRLLSSGSNSFYNGLGQGGPNSGYVGNSSLEGAISKGWSELPVQARNMNWDAFVGWGFYAPFSIFFLIGISGINGCTASMFYLARHIRRTGDMAHDRIIGRTIPRVLVVFAFVSVIELWFISRPGVMFLGEPSVMNVFMIGTGKNIVPFLLVYSITLYLLFLQSLYQARTAKRRAVLGGGGATAWLLAGFLLEPFVQIDHYGFLITQFMAFGLIGVIIGIASLKTLRPEKRQMDERAISVSNKRVQWVHFGEFLGDRGYFIRVSEQTYKLSDDLSYDFRVGDSIEVESDGTGKVRRIGGVVPLRWP